MLEAQSAAGRRKMNLGDAVGLVVLAGLCAVLWLGGPALFRLADPDSKLVWGESRIAHIPAEFIRRSPLFAASWEALKICSNYDECNAASIVALRDEAIRLDWPQVFDRLVVYDDWGNASESAAARDKFFAALTERGADSLRNSCLPKIAFEVLDDGRFYDFIGFVCDGAPAKLGHSSLSLSGFVFAEHV